MVSKSIACGQRHIAYLTMLRWTGAPNVGSWGQHFALKALKREPRSARSAPEKIFNTRPKIRLGAGRDAGNYITKLPRTEHDLPEWLAATEALMPVAEHGGPTMMARIGVMRALRRRVEPAAPKPRKKRARKYRIVR
jgi:hypothetical protein